MYTLALLGGASLEDPDGPITGPVAQRHRIALLALAARSPSGRISRAKLLALLWPESPPSQARHALSQALYVIRRELGSDVLDGSGADVVLNGDRIRSDVADFVEALGSGELEQGDARSLLEELGHAVPAGSVP